MIKIKPYDGGISLAGTSMLVDHKTSSEVVYLGFGDSTFFALEQGRFRCLYQGYSHIYHTDSCIEMGDIFKWVLIENKMYYTDLFLKRSNNQ